ncbi:MAG: dockerin type I domain-containing protein [Ruminococcus sp.]
MYAKKMMISAISILTSMVFITNISALASEDDVLYQGTLSGDTTVSLLDMNAVPASVLSNAESGFLFYDQLDANNQISYEAMTEYNNAPSDTTLTVALSEPIMLNRDSRNIDKWSEEEYTEYVNAVMGAVMPGIIAYTLDAPELFWINFSEIECSLTNNGISYKTSVSSESKYTIYITEIAVAPKYDPNFTDFDEVLEIRDSIKKAVDSFAIEGETDYEKCKNIYQSIADLVTYHAEAPYAHSIAGVLYDTNAVCEGYAKTFKILCDREGIPCLTILGNYNAEALTAHMWNYVYLDGAWYACDLTWDDSLDGQTYFMRGSAMFNQNHTPESPYSIMEMAFPELSVDDYVPTTTTTTPQETTALTTTTTTAVSETTTSDTESTSNSLTTTTTTKTTTTTTTATTAATTYTTQSESSTQTTTTTVTATTTTSSSSTTVTTTEASPLSGDVNQDGKCTIMDVILVRKYLIKIIGKDDLNLMLADCNEDGTVNIFDAVLLMNRILS